jgi:hypothetical protein
MMPSAPIYEFSAELMDYKPKIWRKFQMLNTATMARLGYVLMTLFEMKASHLFRLEVPNERNLRRQIQASLSAKAYENFIKKQAHTHWDQNLVYEIITEDTYEFRDHSDEILDASRRLLKHVISQPGDEILFVYDFGDNWHVLVKLERVFKDKNLSGKAFPRALDGAGFGIIEDCGGSSGLEHLSHAFQQKEGDDYNEYREWLGMDDLDLRHFDINDMNYRLLRIPRIFAEIYEYDNEPSKRSLAILQRQYPKR